MDSLDLSFDNGFTVLTGETGAGKSILLDAIDALFAGSQFGSGSRLLRCGSDKGEVEATFSISSEVSSWLSEHELLDDESEICISREWRLRSNRLVSRSRVNGVAVNRAQILALRSLLIDLTVQGQTHQLVLPGQQLYWLDRLGGSSLDQLLVQVKQSWMLWHASALALQKAIDQKEHACQQAKELQEVLDHLEAASLDDPFEDIKLQKEQDRLAHGVRLSEGICTLLNHLQEANDHSSSVLDRFGVSIQELKAMSKLDDSLIPVLEKSLTLYAGLEDLIMELKQYDSLLESDSSTLNNLQERLAFLKHLQKIYNLNIVELISYRDELRDRQTLSNDDSSINQLQSKEEESRFKRDVNNKLLSSMRKNIARRFEKRLLKYLDSMGLSEVRFEVNIDPINPTEKGSDLVQFLFSANAGQPLAPIGEVTSGGEMSRFLLGLKAILVEVDSSSTLLFDEIDVGVSGRVSSAIGNVLKDLAMHRQVFCITHQPLVAAKADHHFSVSKSTEDGITSSRVCLLHSIHDRTQALAQLAGGEFAEAESYAASLLEQHAA